MTAIRAWKSGSAAHASSHAPARRSIAIAAIVVAMLVLLGLSPLASAASIPQPAQIYLQSVFPVLPLEWLPVALIAVLAVLGVAAVVYQLSTPLGSSNAKAWARNQIYEALLSIVLLLLFIGIIYLFLVSPTASFEAAHLVGQGGQYGTCLVSQDIFQLSTCDLATFNSFAFGVFQGIFYTSFYSGFSSGASVQITQTILNTKDVVGAMLPSFIPLAAFELLSTSFSAILALLLLNQIQLLILAGSLLWLSFFLSLGLIARALGFTRSFGGAMIALGLGLGFIYPLMISLTYGYIDYQISAGACAQFGCTVSVFASGLFSSVIQIVVGGGLPSAQPWLFQLAAAAAGLTFIPFINFTIVDAFIVDLSKAIGERVEFMSMLTGVI